MALDNGLAECVAPHDLPKALAPDRHLPTAMRRHATPAVIYATISATGKCPPRR
jgi:hypothetical protein